ncbi:MAG: hypothetical protein WAS36_01120 [Candidatus Saccharimonadales bacterium]
MNNHFEQLVSYIREQQTNGYDDQAIRQTLLTNGWDPKMVEDGFGYITYNPALSQPASPLPAVTPAQTGPAPKQELFSSDYTQQQPQAQAAATNLDNPESKYKLFRAVGDVVRTLKYGFWRFLGTVVIAYLITAIVYAVVGFGLTAVLLSSLTTGTTFLLFLFIGSIVGTALYAFSWALLVSSASYGLLNSARRGNDTLLTLVKQTLQSVLRVTLATLLFGLVVVGPIILVYMLIFASLFSSGVTSSPAGTVGALVIPLLVFVWVLIALLRYSLVPYVALFETEVPIAKTLKRSKHLLLHGGQWFLFKEGLLVFLLVCIGVLATGQNLSDAQNSPGILTILFTVLFTVTIVSVNYMLYVNRKAVRG